MLRSRTWLPVALALMLALGGALPARAARDAGPRDGYQQLLAKERALTARGKVPSVSQLRTLLVQYEQFVGRYPRSGYSDNALWQAAQIALMLHSKTKRADDRKNALRLLDLIAKEYPSSSLLPRVEQARAEVVARAAAAPKARPTASRPNRSTKSPAAQPAATNRPPSMESRAAASPPSIATAAAGGPPPTPPSPITAVPEAPPPSPLPRRALDDFEPPVVIVATRDAVLPSPEPDVVSSSPASTRTSPPPPLTAATSAASARASVPSATLVDIRRVVLPELVRVTLELDREVAYRDERIDGPPRAVFDLSSVAPSAALDDALLSFKADIVRQIRVGEQAGPATRVVLDLAGAERYSVFTLYNPYRVVVDVFRKAGPQPDLKPSSPAPVIAKASGASSRPGPTANATSPARTVSPTGPGEGREAASEPGRNTPSDVSALPSSAPPLPVAVARAPESAEATADGSFSIARQLGLGVSRIVIDPGHGGHDPGALGKKVTEAELVLDVALRLEKLLRKTPGVEVVLTRRTDVFVPLEERTAIANRAKADLFLSIHANASRNQGARGIETYVLNFALNPEAEAVAARENAASGRSMHHLPDIVKAIALNNKLDESRELARLVQGSLVRNIRGDDAGVRDLGVKQAPFVVLIGAGMPSVLAEISFITNPRDAELLRTGPHRQKIAESLHESILKYQRTLKATDAVAAAEPVGRDASPRNGR